MNVDSNFVEDLIHFSGSCAEVFECWVAKGLIPTLGEITTTMKYSYATSPGALAQVKASFDFGEHQKPKGRLQLSSEGLGGYLKSIGPPLLARGKEGISNGILRFSARKLSVMTPC